MEVNGDKFDEALHHPIYTINKLERLCDNLTRAIEDMAKCYAQVQAIMKDLALYRQELLQSIKEEENGFNKH